MKTYKRPSLRNTDDLWCWMNTWGDLQKHRGRVGPDERLSRTYEKGYQQAIRDLHSALDQLGIVGTDAAWKRWTKG